MPKCKTDMLVRVIRLNQFLALLCEGWDLRTRLLIVRCPYGEWDTDEETAYWEREAQNKVL